MNRKIHRIVTLALAFFATEGLGCTVAAESPEQPVGDVAAPLGTPSLLSATFGANDIAGLFGCVGSTVDGLPVVFSETLDTSTVSPSDFMVTDGWGNPKTPLCATFAPSINADERRTILLQGDFGDALGADPSLVEITGSILTDGGLDFHGQSAPVVPFAVGQYLAYAQNQPLVGNVGGPDQCPIRFSPLTPTRQIVQLAFGSNAVTAFTNMSAYHVMLSTGVEVSPLGFGDVTADNYVELCLGTSTPAVSVRIDAGAVPDASGQPNEEEIAIVLEP